MLRDTARQIALRTLRTLTGRRDEAAAFVQRVGLRRAAQLGATLLGHEDSADATITPWQRVTLQKAMACMCHYDLDAAPSPAQTEEMLDAAVAFTEQMPSITRQKLYDLLTLLEVGPLALGPERVRFNDMKSGAREDYLRIWESSPLEPMRAGFEGLKSVCMMGYWSHSSRWDAIGYGLDTELAEQE